MRIRPDDRTLRKLIQPALDGIAEDYNRDVAALTRQYQGKPADQIKPALRRVFEKRGGKISDTELNEYAQLISAGTKITFRS